MAIIAKINTQGTIGRATIKSSPKTAIAADTFAPKPNIALAEINDVSTTGVQDGDALVFNSATNRYEAKTVTASVTEVIGGFF
jgi:hypothetical protein